MKGWRQVKAVALMVGLVSSVAWLSGCATATDAPKLMTWTVETSNEFVMAGATTDAVVHIDVGAKVPQDLEQRIPLNLSLVLDHSGSMSGDQMDDARQAVIDILRSLHEDDTVSVIAFSTRVNVLMNQNDWDDADTEQLFTDLRAIKPMGTTAMYEALNQAKNEVHQRFDAARINRIILLSDGIPNDAANLRSLAESARASNIGISTFGLGPFYNEDLMAEIADVSGGNYRFIKESKQIEEFFLAEKRSMEQIVARNAQLRVHLGPGVQVVQTLGSEASISGRLVTVFLGDFGASESRQVALRVKITAPASGANVELVDAQLFWDDVVSWSGTMERWAYLQAQSTKDQALIDQHHNKLVEEKAGRLQAAWEMEQAIRDFEAGRKREAERRLRQAAQEYRQKREEAKAQYKYNFDEDNISGELSAPSMAGGGQSLDYWLEEAADDLDKSEPKSNKGKLLIKKTKSRSRKASGR